MKNSILMGMFLVSILMLAGCATTDTSTLTGGSSAKAICGNGIAEKGETADNCCADVPCADGFKCKEKLETGNTIYFCKKLSKEEAYEYKKFQEYHEQIDYEYNKPEQSLINWGSMLSKVESMKDYLSNLKTQRYDVSVDEEFLKHYERRINLNKLVYEKSENFDSLSETEQKAIIDELITLYTTEKDTLSAIESSMKIELDKQYEYDINGKIDYANERITELQALKEKIEKGQSATIDVTTFDSTCYSGNDGYLNSVNIGVKNTGGFAIEYPRIDVFLMDGTRQIDKDTDNYFGYDDIAEGEERFEKISFMLGYLSGDYTPCKKYDLKINLRSGANPKIITTTTVKVEIK